MELDELTAALFKACEEGDVTKLEELQKEANINLAYLQKNDTKKLPFEVAIEKSNIGVWLKLSESTYALASLFLRDEGGSKIFDNIKITHPEVFDIINEACDSYGGEIALETLLPAPLNQAAAAQIGGGAAAGAGLIGAGYAAVDVAENHAAIGAAAAAVEDRYGSDVSEERLKKRIAEIKKMSVGQLVYEMGEIQKVIHEELKSSGFTGDIFDAVRKTLFTAFTTIESEKIAEFYDPDVVKLFGEACEHLGL